MNWVQSYTIYYLKLCIRSKKKPLCTVERETARENVDDVIFPVRHTMKWDTVSLLCKRRVRKSHGENLVSPGKLDAGGQVELEQQQLRKKSDGGGGITRRHRQHKKAWRPSLWYQFNKLNQLLKLQNISYNHSLINKNVCESEGHN